MKINKPVTGIEVDYPADYNILSTTDPKGSLTYTNEDFIQISGFQEDELIGKNHNVVRHPDMPPAAFDNLWSDLKAGKSWMGLVKNRCKNGDHYWVDAFVTPITEHGEVVEYQSVRSKPERKLVERAEKYYPALMAGKVPAALRIPALSLRNRLVLAALTAMVPVAVVAIATGGVWAWGATAVSAGLAYGLVTLATRRLNRVVEDARGVVDNKLIQFMYTHSTDDISQIEVAMRMLRANLNAFVGRVDDSCHTLQTVVQQSKQSQERSNQGVMHQLSEIDQVATAINEMSATVQEVASNTSTAAETAQQAQHESVTGQRVVQETISSINNLSQDMERASKVIQELQEHSSNISTVLDVINGIAEQTNLLALNAAIEAARAGEAGRGFAVVADEVRTLAQRTQESTLEIQVVIDRLQGCTKEAVNVMESGQQSTSASVEQAAHAGESLEAITRAVSGISDVNTQIASAAEEQSAVAEELNRNVSSISQIAQQTADDAKENDKLSKQLSHETERQQQLVRQFFMKQHTK